MNESAKGIVADPEIMHGKPVIEGTRVPVEVVLNTLAEDVEVEKVCEEFGIDRKQVSNAVRFAADRISAEEYRAIQA